MLYSMTGFGRATGNFGAKTISVEARSLNSKSTDIKLKLPQQYRQKEIDLRKTVKELAGRGKVEINLEVQSDEEVLGQGINAGLYKSYVKQLRVLNADLGLSEGEITAAVLRIPNVIENVSVEIGEEEWTAIVKVIGEAMAKMNDFRETEGASIEQDFRERVEAIASSLKSIVPYEGERIDKVRERLRQNLKDFVNRDKVDENRFEQEIVFYLEKMDLNEEKVRLEQHCKYFIEQLDSDKMEKGRKLNFISQEMGREINTIGSKANHHEIQKLVVKMKDELEKIKEQCSNVL